MSTWNEVNQNLIAKAIGEMIFEENINYEVKDDGFLFKAKANVHYFFKGKLSIWSWIKVDPKSLLRNGEKILSASQFFIDTQDFTQMSDITLSQFLEEMRSTLFADLHLNHKISANEFIRLNFLESQQLLNGHPKILLNKGRMGWSIEDWKSFAPENGPTFPLKLIAIRSKLLRGVLPTKKLYQGLITEEKLSEVSQKIDLNEYTLMPIHPWQWRNVISYHYQDEIQSQAIIDLGETNYHFSPQTSLRTLNCIENLKSAEVKLSLSILNTSCIRGIPAKTVELGVKISESLKQIIDQDTFLKNNLEILSELAGINFIAKDLDQIENSPYRFKEFLGVIWRESAFSKINGPKQNIILTANLLYQDENQNSSIAALIKTSGLSPKEWIKEYTKVVIIPLLYLQKQHGIGLVSHGQNIMLILEENRPKKLVIKDFQGDFRFSSTAPDSTREIFGSLFDEVLNLSQEHLIHDLYTAHFVTLLRYVAMNLDQENVLSENEFYEAIAEELIIFEDKNPFGPSLMKEKFEKILVNTVRFKIGYGDSAQRPLPILGTTILNPLYQVRL